MSSDDQRTSMNGQEQSQELGGAEGAAEGERPEFGGEEEPM